MAYNETLFTTLQKLVSEQGEAILADSRRVGGYLADYAHHEPKAQRNALVRCLEYGFYGQLKDCSVPDRSVIKERLARRLHDDEGLELALCTAALDVLEAVMWGPAAYTPAAPSPQPAYTPPASAYQPPAAQTYQAPAQQQSQTTLPAAYYASTSPAIPAPAVPVQSQSQRKAFQKLPYGICAILLGGLGINSFIAGNIGMGVLKILFCWTGIPHIVSLIQGIIALCRPEAWLRQTGLFSFEGAVAPLTSRPYTI